MEEMKSITTAFEQANGALLQYREICRHTLNELHEKKEMNNMDEINRLYNWLMEHKDFYGWCIEKIDRHPYDSFSPWYQVIIYDKDDERLWDAVWHSFSYGFEEGLLEIMGDKLVDEEEDGDCVVGWLTADDVIERVIKVYGEPKMKEE